MVKFYIIALLIAKEESAFILQEKFIYWLLLSRNYQRDFCTHFVICLNSLVKYPILPILPCLNLLPNAHQYFPQVIRSFPLYNSPVQLVFSPLLESVDEAPGERGGQFITQLFISLELIPNQSLHNFIFSTVPICWIGNRNRNFFILLVGFNLVQFLSFRRVICPCCLIGNRNRRIEY